MILGLLAIFRNEAQHLDEFFKHYINQGVDRFYLIDNASEDNPSTILDNYQNHIAHLKHEPRVINLGVMNHNQRDVQFHNYNELFNNVIKTSDTNWLIICDIDEFIYARHGYNNIREFLESQGSEFDQILIREKVFCSNNHKTQPVSVIDGFTQRVDYSKYNVVVSKSISRVQSIDFVHVHYSVLKPETSKTVDDTLERSTNFLIRKNKRVFIEERNRLIVVDEDILKKGYLACNHYYIQSKEWFFGTKAIRGVAALGHDHGDIMADKWNKIWQLHESYPKIIDAELQILRNNNYRW